MHIRHVDPAGDAADMAAVLPVVQAAHAAFVPGEPVPGEQRVRVWTGPSYQSTQVTLAVFPDAAATEAIGVMMAGGNETNPDFIGASTYVAPDFDGPQVSALLMEAMTGYGREHGVKRLMVNTAVNADAVRYAPQRSPERTFRGVRSGLDLTAVDRAEFASLSAPSAANDAYRIVHWIDSCPEDLAEAYCVAEDAMNDAPAVADDLAHPVHDVERLRAEEASTIAIGVRRLVTAALGPGGAIGGYSMTAVYPREPGFTEIWDTAVARDHRGRGLGLRMKAAATLWLLREHPEARVRYTFNATNNEHMIAVNRKLGYRPAAEWEMFLHDIEERWAPGA